MTEINIYKMLKKIEELKANKNQNKKWMLFLDFAKAYDTVDHKILFQKMKKLNINDRYGIQMMFNNL